MTAGPHGGSVFALQMIFGDLMRFCWLMAVVILGFASGESTKGEQHYVTPDNFFSMNCVGFALFSGCPLSYLAKVDVMYSFYFFQYGQY